MLTVNFRVAVGFALIYWLGVATVLLAIVWAVVIVFIVSVLVFMILELLLSIIEIIPYCFDFLQRRLFAKHGPMDRSKYILVTG